MILIIDNYDSFVHNLARYVREAGAPTLVVRNDEISARALLQKSPDGVIISPGPKTPKEAGISLEIIRELSHSIPLLGVCLGHQCMVEAFGGTVARAAEPMHGEASWIRHDEQGIFTGIENPMAAGRYHSLIAAPPPDGPLAPCAYSEKGEVMAVRHQSAPWHGVQFHPESLLTPSGRRMVSNFVNLACSRVAA